MKINFLISATLLTSAAFLTGCYTTYFQNGPSHKEAKTMDYNLDYDVSLFTHSDPVDLKKTCGGKKWEAVRMERGLFDYKIGVNCK